MLKIIYLSLVIFLTACQVSVTSPTLEVIGIYHDEKNHLDSVTLLTTEPHTPFKHFHLTLNPKKHGQLAVGERVQITGNIEDRKINHITQIIHLENPDKARCEATQGNYWRPQGMAQIPACITTYTDAGKHCTASNQCQGKCIVTSKPESAVCANSSSPFGCRASIEAFNAGEGIMCLD